jgi:monofunctional biosynthetic peptidoglycan transglycosylase
MPWFGIFKGFDRLRKKHPNKSGWRLLMRTAVMWSLFLLLIFLGCSTLQVICTRYLNPIVTLPMLVEWIGSHGGPEGKLATIEWRDLDRIGPHLQKAVLAGEDQRFFNHNGFDMVELSHALDDAVSGRGIRGASTISMQTARTVFLWRGRHLSRKLLEAYYTFLLEAFWTKRRILEVYLNTVDWGDRIWGAKAAAAAYYRAEPNMLSKDQAAWLAAILPNPHRWSPVKPTSHLKRRQRRIRSEMPQMRLPR